MDAYDTSGNHSARSPIVAGTSLPDVTPPTVPTNVAATAQSPTVVTITWTASVDDYMVGSYPVYRGTSPTTLKQIGYSAAPQINYVDSTAVAGKTYYYAVTATDVAKNQSAQSTVVSITTP